MPGMLASNSPIQAVEQVASAARPSNASSAKGALAATGLVEAGGHCCRPRNFEPKERARSARSASEAAVRRGQHVGRQRSATGARASGAAIEAADRASRSGTCAVAPAGPCERAISSSRGIPSRACSSAAERRVSRTPVSAAPSSPAPARRRARARRMPPVTGTPTGGTTTATTGEVAAASPVEASTSGAYYDPFGRDQHRSMGSAGGLWPSYYRSNYWLNDPWQYRLPPAYGPYRWVRYYNDALLVNIYTGRGASTWSTTSSGDQAGRGVGAQPSSTNGANFASRLTKWVS